MRRGRAIVFATALEVLSEPFFLLVLLAALMLVSIAPAMHYHQFGEASRMARDAGLSAILACGAIIAFACPAKTVRRELETGTAQVALSHSISRTSFFLCKMLGCAAAYAIFVLTVAASSMTIVNGAEIGGRIAISRGDIARVWGPSFAFAFSPVFLCVVIGAVLNRFARFRFVLTASMLALVLSLCGTFYRFDASLVARYAPAFALASVPSLVLLSFSGALALRFKSNVALSVLAVLLAAMLPIVGAYSLSDVLADGGRIPILYLALAVLAASPAVAAALLLGVHFINGRDLQ